MATQNGRLVSQDPRSKRPRLSYNGYQPERVLYQASTAKSHTFSVQTSQETETTEKPQWLWTFSRNVFNGLVEGSKMAVESLKLMGSFLLGNQGPWLAAEQNGSFDEDDYEQASNPGQKRKRRAENGWESINLQSELSLAHLAVTSATQNLNGKDDSSPKRRNMFETPWTNPTQKEALMKSYGSGSPQGLPRPRSRNSERPSGSSASPAKSLTNDLEMDDIFEASFNEELEPTGEAVLSASPERIAAAEQTRPQGLPRLTLKNFLEKTSGDCPKLVQQTAQALADIDETEETFSGHIETEEGVRDSHDGQMCDALDLGKINNQPVLKDELTGEEEDDDEYSDDAEEEDDGTGEDISTASSSEDEEEEASQRSCDLVAELAADAIALLDYQNEKVDSAPENPMENFGEFISELGSEPDIIPSSLPTEKMDHLDPYSTDFVNIDHAGNFDGDVSSNHLENSLLPSADDPEFEDNPDAVLADEEEYEEESEEEVDDDDEEDNDGLEAAADSSNNSEDIICEGIFIGSQANSDQQFVFEGSDVEQEEDGEPEDDGNFESESESGSEADENGDDDAEGSR